MGLRSGAVPAGAFFAWTPLSGANGVVLWKPFAGLTGGWEFLVAAPLAVILLGLAIRLNPSESSELTLPAAPFTLWNESMVAGVVCWEDERACSSASSGVNPCSRPGL